MNIKSLLFFSLLFFSSMHAMHDGPFDPLKDAQQRFFAAIEDDTKDEKQKIAALKKILDANPDNKAAILNCIRTVNDKNQTAFSIALEKDLATENEEHTVLQYLVQQPEFNVNHVENYKISKSRYYKNRTPLNAIIATLKSVKLAKFLTLSEDTDSKEKKLIKIAKLILETHKKNINTPQLFDAYKALLSFPQNISNKESIKQNIENLLLTIINHEKFDVNHINNKGFTPLAIAVISTNCPVNVIQALIGKGADLNKKYYPSHSYKFFNTPYSILDIAIDDNKYYIAEILYKAGARTINPKMYNKLNYEMFPDKKKPTFLAAIANTHNSPLTVNSWSSVRTSSLSAISGLTILYDFCRFKKAEKVTDDKKETKAKAQEKSKKDTKHDKKAKAEKNIKNDKKKISKEKKELSRLERLAKHAHNYKKDLLKNPRNHKKLLIPVACLLFRLLKDPIQYRNTRFA